MKTLLVILFLLVSSGVLAQDLQTYESYTPRYGSGYSGEPFSNKYQEQDSYVDKPGSYLKYDGRKLQQ